MQSIGPHGVGLLKTATLSSAVCATVSGLWLMAGIDMDCGLARAPTWKFEGTRGKTPITKLQTPGRTELWRWDLGFGGCFPGVLVLKSCSVEQKTFDNLARIPT